MNRPKSSRNASGEMREALPAPMPEEKSAFPSLKGNKEKELQWLLEKINEVQLLFFETASAQTLFNRLLEIYLDLTQSEYGFIGEILNNTENEPYLKTYAITNIAWTDELKEFYAKEAPKGLEFFNMRTLFGQVITSGKTLIANDPGNDPRSGGLPEGHPDLNAFLGIPLFSKSKLIGMVGLANRPQKYDDGLVNFINPLSTTCGNLIHAFQLQKRRVISENITRQREQQLKAVVDNVVDGIITIDEHGTIQAFNKSAERIFGYRSLEVIGKNVKLLMPEPYSIEHDEYIERYLNEKTPRIIGIGRDVEGRRKDGTTFPLNLGISEMISGDRKFFIGITRDISENKRAIEVREQLASIVENTDDAILCLQLDGTISLWNEAARKIFGYMETEIIGKHLSYLIPPDRSAEAEYVMEKVLRGEILNNFETKRVCKMGNVIDVSVTASPIRDDKGNVIGISTIERNISHQKKLLLEKEELIKKLEEVTLKDPLTGLYNRRGLLERVNYEMARYRRGAKPFSIIIADLDHFKEINDRWGHSVGDEALRHISLILKRVHRTTDTVCRWGGEEFLILLMETDLKGARFLAEHIRKTVEQTPINVNNNEINLTLSLGVSFLDNPMTPFDDLIKEADQSMYKAKRKGRNRVELPDRFNDHLEAS